MRTHAVAAAFIVVVAALSLMASAQRLDTCGTDSMAVISDLSFDIIGFDFDGVAPVVEDYCECAELCETNTACRLLSFDTVSRMFYLQSLSSPDANTKSPGPPASSITIFSADPLNLRFNGAVGGAVISAATAASEDICINRCIGTILCRYVVYSEARRCQLFSGDLSLRSRIGVKAANSIVTSTSTTTTRTTTTTTTTTTRTTTTTTTTTTSLSTFLTGSSIAEGSTTATSQRSSTTGLLGGGVETAGPTSSPGGNQGTNNQGLVIGLAVSGSVVGVLIVGAGIAYWARMAARKKGGLPRNDTSLFDSSVGVGAASTSSGAALKMGSSNNGLSGGAVLPPIPEKDDAFQQTPSGYDTMGPGANVASYGNFPSSHASNYSSTGAPVTIPTMGYNSAYGYYPSMPTAYAGGYGNQSYAQPEQQQAFTVEQYLASGWTMDQIHAFKPPLAQPESQNMPQ
ncbi:hypothetical protein HDU67_008282 [Dinochytrium kinnereticum]|nr:hypothetical protein HDU67_008282 [Dinochytrium kinnereticum]